MNGLIISEILHISFRLFLGSAVITYFAISLRLWLKHRDLWDHGLCLGNSSDRSVNGRSRLTTVMRLPAFILAGGLEETGDHVLCALSKLLSWLSFAAGLAMIGVILIIFS